MHLPAGVTEGHSGQGRGSQPGEGRDGQPERGTGSQGEGGAASRGEGGAASRAWCAERSCKFPIDNPLSTPETSLKNLPAL